MFSIKEFLGFTKNDGLSRQNRFYTMITQPYLMTAGTEEMRKISLLCNSVSVGGVNVSSTPVRITGEVIEVPYDRTFSGATLTFYVDRQMYIRKFFEDWVNNIQAYNTRILNYYDDYISPVIEIYNLDKKNRMTFGMFLWDVFPKTIGPLSLAFSNNDIMTFDVTFDYRYYTTEIIETPNTSEPSDITNKISDVSSPLPGMQTGIPNFTQNPIAGLTNITPNIGANTTTGLTNYSQNNVTNALNNMSNAYQYNLNGLLAGN